MRDKIGIAIVVLLVVAGINALAGEDRSDSTPRPPSSTTSESDQPDAIGSSPSGGSNASSKQSNAKAKKKTEKAPEQTKLGVRGPMVLVNRVIDGDTIEVLFNGTERSVRLIGIDTPETVHPSQPVECFGHAASDFATNHLSGRKVRLEFDVERFDHYDRLLAYVWVGSELFNRTIVARGFGHAYTYPPNVKYTGRFVAAQRSAREANRGLWDSCPLGVGSAGGGGGSSSNDNQNLAGTGGGCDGYDPCLSPASDYDCAGGSGDGPEYAKGPIKVTGSDPYDLDSDGDGVACED